ncbi:MAG: TonB-dependent receptor [Bryobacteraceae bacterium]|nr:TonB-dependent receptor [Bryobacteraceae bacterium]
MKARPFFFFENRLPKNILNQWGGTFGGPIKKNKLFFFANWERTTRRQFAFNFRTIATDALKGGDYGASGVTIFDPSSVPASANGVGRLPFPNNRIPLSSFDPAARTMLGLLPAPNQPGTINNNYLATGTYAFNRDNADFKVNYNATDKASMFVRYSYSPSNIFDPPSLGAAGGDALTGGQPGTAPGLIQTASVGGTYTLSSRLLFDGNVGFTRQRLGAQNVDIDKNFGLDDLRIPGTNGSDRLQGGYPRFNIVGFSALGNPNVSNPFLFRDHQYTVTANLGYVRGAHSFRFGYDYQYLTINHFQPQAAFGPRGGFNFTGGLSALNGGAAPNLYNSLADFSLGIAQALGKDVQYLNPATVRMPSHGFYARDNWQVNRKLTINYGIRYEIYPFGKRDHTGFGRYDVATDRVIVGGLGGNPTNSGVDVGKGQWAPRLGIAYRLDDKTVIRAGFGISIDPNNFRQMRDAYPATISSQFTGATTFQSAGTLRTGIPVVQGPDLSSPTLILPPALQTTTYPLKINRGYIRSYNITIQRELGAGVNIQAGYVTTKSIRQFSNLNLNWAPPGTGNAGRQLFGTVGRIGTINFFTPFKDSNYDSLQTTVVKRFASSASNLGLAYTWSKAINYADNSESGLTWNQVSIHERNRALAGYDRPHNIAVYGNYEVPFGKGQKYLTSGVASKLMGGWQLNGIFTAASGQPFTVTSNGASLNAVANAQTADQVKSTVDMPRGVGRGASWFDPTAFAPITTVRYGSTGRNILRAPGRVNLDASLFRNFRVMEKVTMQFRFEAFNVSNTPQFNPPGADVSSPTRNPDGSIRALNNFTEVTSAVNERQLRFAFKFFF